MQYNRSLSILIKSAIILGTFCLIAVPARTAFSAADTAPPVLSIISPAALSTVSGSTVVITVSAADDTGVAKVSFQINNSAPIDDQTAPYSVSWNTFVSPNGPYTITATAFDTTNNSASAEITVTVDNLPDTTPPVVNSVYISSINQTSVTIVWTTDEPSDTQIDYGLTTGYGSQTPLRSFFVTDHSETIGGLSAGTVYNYRVRSRDASGNLSISANRTITTPPDSSPPPPPAFSQTHPSGTLTLQSNGTIYLIRSGQRLGFRDPNEYKSHGYRFDQAVSSSSGDNTLPEGRVIKALPGTLALDTADGRTIYMIGQNDTKRGFVSSAVFFDLGYRFEQAIPINLSDYPTGAPIDSDAPAHPEGTLIVDATGTVWWVLSGQRQGFESAEVFRTYGWDFARVVPANGSDQALPEGPLVKFRDGTLVNDSGTLYIISDGQKKRFTDASQLVSLGYREGNVIGGSLQNYSEGSAVE